MKCKKYREWIILYLYGELGREEKRRLSAHLEKCPACRADLDETRRMFHLVRQVETTEAPDADWNRCWGGIRRGIRSRDPMRRTHFLIPRWVPAAAAVLITVFGLGIYLGRTLRSGPATGGAESPRLSPAAARYSLNDHFETLKPVLIEYANYDERGGDSRITTDRALLQNLLIQNILLMRLLARDEPGAAVLLEDIELVLREITNAQGREDSSPAQIRSLLEEREILFKMDIIQSF